MPDPNESHLDLTQTNPIPETKPASTKTQPTETPAATPQQKAEALEDGILGSEVKLPPVTEPIPAVKPIEEPAKDWIWKKMGKFAFFKLCGIFIIDGHGPRAHLDHI